MPPPSLSSILADLRAPGVTDEDATDILVEYICWHRSEGVERYIIGQDLARVVKNIPSHLLSAFTTAKDQTLFIPSALSKEAFALSSTRTSINSFLKTRGLLEPNLSREVLLEYTGRKERVVKGWPGGVRAGIEVVQGGLRDVGIELGTSPLTHLVEEIQLETGHISLSQLMRILRALPSTPPVACSTDAANQLLESTRAGAVGHLERWARRCLEGGASRYEVGIELEEIKRQLPNHLHSIFPSLTESLNLPSTPIHPHAHGIATLPRLILPALQADPSPEFAKEVLLEWVSVEKRRAPGAWGRKERKEMGAKLGDMERAFIEKLDLPALAPVFALVRQQTRCPPYLLPAALENSSSNSPKPYIIAATLSLKPRTLTDDEVKGMLYGYVEGERGKALVNEREKEEEEVWTESERRRVGAVLESIREKLNDDSLNAIFQSVKEKTDCPPSALATTSSSSPIQAMVFLPVPTSSNDSSRSNLNSSSPPAANAGLPNIAPSSSFYNASTSVTSSERAFQSASTYASPYQQPADAYPTRSSIDGRISSTPISAATSNSSFSAPSPADSPQNTSARAKGEKRRSSFIFPSKEEREEKARREREAKELKEREKLAAKAREREAREKKEREKREAKEAKKMPGGSISKATSRPRSKSSAASSPLTSTAALPLHISTSGSHDSHEPSEPYIKVPSSPVTAFGRYNRLQAERRTSLESSSPSIARHIPPSQLLRSGSADSVLHPPTFHTPRSTEPTGNGLGSDAVSTTSADSNKRRRRPAVVVKTGGSRLSSSISSDHLPSRDNAVSAVGDINSSFSQPPAPEPASYQLSERSLSMVDLRDTKVDGPQRTSVVSESPSNSKRSSRLGWFASSKNRHELEDLTSPIDPVPLSDREARRLKAISTKRRALSTSSIPPQHQVGPISLPSLEMLLSPRDFPTFNIPPPHRIRSPPRSPANELPPQLPGSTSVLDRTQWRPPASWASKGSGTGASSPPIQEGDHEGEEMQSNVGGEGGSSEGRSTSGGSGGIMSVPNSDLGHGGLIIPAFGASSQLSPWRQSAFLRRQSSVTPDSPSLYPHPSEPQLEEVEQASHHLSDPANSLDPRSPSIAVTHPIRQQPLSHDPDSPTPSREVEARRDLLYSPITPTAEIHPFLAPSASFTPIALARSISPAPSTYLPYASPSLNGSPRQVFATLLETAANSPSSSVIDLSTTTDPLPSSSQPSTSSRNLPSSISQPSGPAVRKTSRSLPTPPVSALKVAVLTTVPLDKKSGPLELLPTPSLPPPPPSTSLETSTLTLRGVFDRLKPDVQHSSGEVLDTVMAYIDNERNRSLLANMKKGWSSKDRDRVGYFLTELEETLAPTNPHLATTFQRIKLLTDCPPQNPSSSKRRHSSRSTSSLISRSPSQSTVSSFASDASTSSTATSSSLASESSRESSGSEATVMADGDEGGTELGHRQQENGRRDVLGVDLEGRLRVASTTSSSGDSFRTTISTGGPTGPRPRPIHPTGPNHLPSHSLFKVSSSLRSPSVSTPIPFSRPSAETPTATASAAATPTARPPKLASNSSSYFPTTAASGAVVGVRRVAEPEEGTTSPPEAPPAYAAERSKSELMALGIEGADQREPPSSS